jgi:proline dehydrogenase
MHTLPDFSNTEVAFAHKTDKDLKRTEFVFSMMQSPTLTRWLTRLTLISLKIHLPIESLLKATIFRQFCGGEHVAECTNTYKMLRSKGVEGILDYSVEGQEAESTFDSVQKEIYGLIDNAKKYAQTPIACIKITGIARFALLQKITEKGKLSETEQAEWQRVQKRLDTLCERAANQGVTFYIDAEETWIQPAIDGLAEAMMRKYNREVPRIFSTIQMYRHDRLYYLEQLINAARAEGWKVGMKIVRGAYLEKENERAVQMGYPTPMQSNKAATDRDYNAAVHLCVQNIDMTAVCAGTHNEESCTLLAKTLLEKGIDKAHPHVFFSQLFGMSDNITFNLARENFNVSKYLPYGPVRYTMPYLIRRAEENTSVAGQVGKELTLVKKEILRRSKQK